MFRLISFQTHSAIEILAGFALMVLPAVLGLGTAAAVTGVLVGAILMGLAVAGAGQDHSAGSRGTIPIGAHALYDRGIALGLILAALVLGIAGDRGAVLFFVGAGISLLALATSTRYSVVEAR